MLLLFTLKSQSCVISRCTNKTRINRISSSFQFMFCKHSIPRFTLHTIYRVCHKNHIQYTYSSYSALNHLSLRTLILRSCFRWQKLSLEALQLSTNPCKCSITTLDLTRRRALFAHNGARSFPQIFIQAYPYSLTTLFVARSNPQIWHLSSANYSNLVDNIVQKT